MIYPKLVTRIVLYVVCSITAITIDINEALYSFFFFLSTASDPDGDDVRCRWPANTDEGGDVFQPMGMVLDQVISKRFSFPSRGRWTSSRWLRIKQYNHVWEYHSFLQWRSYEEGEACLGTTFMEGVRQMYTEQKVLGQPLYFSW